MARENDIPDRYRFRAQEIIELDERLARLRQDLTDLTVDDPDLAGMPGRDLLFEPEWTKEGIYRVEPPGRSHNGSQKI